MKPVGAALGAPAPQDPRARLRHLAHQLEGVFMQQLFQAMRKSVPEGGAIEPEAGNELYNGLFDEAMAAQAAERSQHGIGEALYRQLSRHLPPETAPAAAPTAPKRVR